jgi:hypothetical protein
MSRPTLPFAALAILGVLANGCSQLSGPSLPFIAPRVTGTVIDANTGEPIPRATVGRTLWTHRHSTGGFLKAAEELVLRQDFATTDASGRFTLPEQRVALLFSLGETRPNLRLAVSHGGHHPWTTNYPIAALKDDPSRPELEAGTVKIQPKR